MPVSVKLSYVVSKKTTQILLLQRGKYYGFTDQGTEYSVFNQATDIDDSTVTNNVGAPMR